MDDVRMAWLAAALVGGLSAVTACAVDVAGGRAAAVPPPFIQTALSLDLTVDYDRPAIVGTATLTVENVGKAPVREVPLLLNRLMSVGDVRDGAGTRLTCRSAVATFEDDPFRQVTSAVVTLPSAIAPGARATVRVRYAGPLVGYVETGSLYIRDRIDPEFTILRSDALAFPIVGTTSVAADRAMRRDADFDFDARIVVPSNELVATGGTLVGTQATGARTAYRFAGKGVPFLNIAIAPYRLVEDSSIRVYAFPADAARGRAVLDAGRQAMRLLEKWYGPLPAATHVTVIEIPEGFGSQASATAGIILDASAFKDTRQLPQLYHELSHLWNAADLDAPSPRWNEGLAMYLQFRLARELDGFAGTDAALERTRSRLCEPAARVRVERTPFRRYGADGETDNAYGVGLLMFSALERVIGADALDARVRAYVQAHLARGGTTAEFLAALAEPPLTATVTPLLHDWFETSDWVAPVCSATSFDAALARWRR